LYQILEVFKSLENTRSSIEKQSILKNNDSMLLRKVLVYALDPFKVYGIKKITSHPQGLPANYVCQPEDWFAVLDRLADRRITGQYAVETVAFEWNAAGEFQELFKRILLKDLRCGVDVSTVNKVFPGLIPTFDVQLAEDYSEKRASWPAQGEVKLDGKRLTSLVYEKEGTKLYSRNGKEDTNFPHINAELDKLRSYLSYDIVLDGEMMWGMFGSRSQGDMKQYVTFDWMTRREWESQACKHTQESRTKSLLRLIEHHTLQYVKPTTVRTLQNYEEALSFYNEVVEAGGEGIMLKKPDAPYLFDRGYNWLKLKPVKDVDLKIISRFEGEGKYRGMLGGIVVDFNGFPVRVGSGFSDAQRKEWWDRGMNELLLIEKTAEIRYTEVTPDGSLRFPRFVRLRDDK
jgi:DNA ligase-1